MTQQQLHHALVAAGDEDALTIRQICDRAGARVLKYPPAYGRYAPGDTMAVGTIQALLGRRHAAGARRVIEICAKGMLAPISANALRAVEHLCFAEEYKGEIGDDDLATIIRGALDEAEKEAARFAAEHDLVLWRALAATWFKARKKARHGR